MLITDIIAKKRDKQTLAKEEIEFFVSGAADNTIPDYQLSALLMAICINGMNEQETAWLTLAMANSGDLLDLSSLGDKTVDKHSTGGVGDKTTLICAPIAAALGCTVAKMSGRGLGHTGGTVDKLEAITGYKTTVSREEFLKNAQNNNICLIGNSGNFVPADKKLYSLRDVTSTVESIPLIASSIMSKKIAAGAKNIVLDVKYGNGAFMKTAEDAEKLALEMVRIGKNVGRKTTAVITDMNIPLGVCIGNSLEVEEAVQILKGKGDERLTELCLTLAANMYSLCFNTDSDSAYKKAAEVLQNGKAFEKLCTAVKAQGGDIGLLSGENSFNSPESTEYLFAKTDGYINLIDSFLLGKAACQSGAGRATKDDSIDFTAGIELLKKYGEPVKKGEKIARIQGKKEALKIAFPFLETAFSISAEKPKLNPLIYKIIKEENLCP